MNKLITIAALLLMQLMLAPAKAQALPLFSGTTQFNFFPGNTATVDWSVYAPGGAGSLSGSASDYTYQYTLSGWSGYEGNAQLDIWTGMTPGITGTGSTSAGATAPTPTVVGAALSYGFFSMAISGPDLTLPANSITGWFTSAIAPTYTVAQLFTGPAWNTMAGAGIDTQLIMSANMGTTPFTGPPGGLPPGAAMPPGAPEPQTWALLITLMGFTTFWLRRRQDDEALETNIAA